MALIGYSGAWVKLFLEKKPEAENLVSDFLSIICSCFVHTADSSQTDRYKKFSE
jgi:hypothetical protein